MVITIFAIVVFSVDDIYLANKFEAGIKLETFFNSSILKTT